MVLPTQHARGIDRSLTETRYALRLRVAVGLQQAVSWRSDLNLATPDGVCNRHTQLTVVAAISGNQISELFAKVRVFARELGQVNVTHVIGKLKRALKRALNFLPVVRGHVALSIA